MNNSTDIRKILLEQIESSVEQSIVRLTDQKLAKEFAKYYYQQAPVNNYTSDSIDINGSFLCLWNLVKERKPNQTIIKAYNPNLEEQQWHSTHTVIDVLTADLPFIVSSLTLALDRKKILVHSLSHPVINTERNEQGKLSKVLSHDIKTKEQRVNREAIIRFEVDRQSTKEELVALERNFKKIIQNVEQVVADWPLMRKKLDEAIDTCKQSATHLPKNILDESIKYLQWLKRDNFLFVGYKYCTINYDKSDVEICSEPDSFLGSFRRNKKNKKTVILSPFVVAKLRAPELLIITKSTRHSDIQRFAYLDHLGIKHFSEDGNIIGEWRFVGLFTSNAYIEPMENIPLLNSKAQQLLQMPDVPRESHSSRAISHIINSYPRDELLQATFEQLSDIFKGILESQESRELKVFLRPDSYDQFVSAMVYIQRDHFNTDVSEKIKRILMEELKGDSIDSTIRISEHPLAQIYLIVHCKNANEKNLTPHRIEERMNNAMLSWQDKLHKALMERQGEAEGNVIFKRYTKAFSASYRDEVNVYQAISDIDFIESLDTNHPIKAHLYHSIQDIENLHFRVIGRGKMLSLSSVMPILEHMGVDVASVSPYHIKLDEYQRAWILDFRINTIKGIDLENKQLKDQFQETFIRVWMGEIENDRFNSLVLSANISWRKVVLLRAIAKHQLQLSVPFSVTYMQDTLKANTSIVNYLVQLFEIRFNPSLEKEREKKEPEIIEKIKKELEHVSNIDEDRILRNYLIFIQSMLRTNFYQLNDNNSFKSYLSFKIATSKLPFAPLPHPAYEIFVYSTLVEGVHMRGGKVARGGLRWSDRQEDFRTEILGLIKAQMVKNSVIVPVGAKGGFVPKQLPQNCTREEYQTRGIESYKTFMSGLLDLTDNLVNNEIIPPKSVIRYDDDDPYFVVAADKGTATFSDIANSVSQSYNFWLGDAFASGGSQGYDHKKMGITARGAWESVKCLFQELGRDTQSQNFTVVGIGDMSGDVFGNGMLLSEHIQLIAAFNHLHIFIDPSPDAALSFKERKRLFDLPRSSWSDYNLDLISNGGGVYSRQSKLIPLSVEACTALGLQETKPLTPSELIHAIIKAPVDLLWNGGIGTYVKASFENHDEVGDRTNNSVRVNAAQLRAKVVGEGGNLGFTQSARIEFDRHGGLINSDAVDNSAGVDTSDHEVNIKILLNQLVAAGDMTIKQRNKLLEEMTDEIACLVLRHNQMQSKRLSLSTMQSIKLFNYHRLLIKQLEAEGRLNKKLERLPSDVELKERAKRGEGLSRPEISVLLSFAKIKIFDELVEQNIDEDPYLGKMLLNYFPSRLRTQYADEIYQHQLKKEILATHIANEVGNIMGAPFVEFVKGETHFSTLDIIKGLFCYLAYF